MSRGREEGGGVLNQAMFVNLETTVPPPPSFLMKGIQLQDCFVLKKEKNFFDIMCCQKF